MDSSVKVSVACPTFEYYGRGVEVLDDMFRTISNQTLKDVEVVVSDHSRTDEIEDYCKKNEHDLNIKYLRNENGRGIHVSILIMLLIIVLERLLKYFNRMIFYMTLKH